MTATDDTITSIKKWKEMYEEIYHNPERKSQWAEQVKTCDNIIKSKESTAERKLSAMIQKEILLMQEQNWTGQLGDLSQGLMLAQNIKMVELQVDLLSTISVESGILNKVKEIEEVTKLKGEINRFKELLKEQYGKNAEREKRLREHMEKLNKDFRYVC
jgi:hypothetical protein